MVYWFECLLGLAAVALAARVYGFWRVFPLALVGAGLILHGGNYADYADSSTRPVIAVIGGCLVLFATLRRNTALAPTAGAVGLYTLLLSAILSLRYTTGLMSSLLLGPAAMALFVAAWMYRSRLAPVVAVGALALLAYLGIEANYYGVIGEVRDAYQSWYYGLSTPTVVVALALPAIWVVAFVAITLFAPKKLIWRTLLYCLIGLELIIDMRSRPFSLIEASWFTTLLTENDSVLRWIGAVFLVIAVLVLARHKLFRLDETAANAPAPDVFISYKREERERVEAIADALRGLGLAVWFDARLVSGKSFDDEINQQVRTAKAVLVCWSRGAANSEWVRAEASIGRERGVLRACFLEPCDLFPPFNLVHAEDLSAGALNAANPGWVRLVDQLGGLTGRPGLGASLAPA